MSYRNLQQVKKTILLRGQNAWKILWHNFNINQKGKRHIHNNIFFFTDFVVKYLKIYSLHLENSIENLLVGLNAYAICELYHCATVRIVVDETFYIMYMFYVSLLLIYFLNLKYFLYEWIKQIYFSIKLYWVVSFSLLLYFRVANLDLLSQYGADSWRSHCHILQEMFEAQQKKHAEIK